MKKSITFESKLENISIIEKLADELSEDYKLDSLLYGNILISLVEAVSNAMKHGNKMNKNKNVSLSYAINDDILKCTICDEGAGFDYTKLPDPTSETNIDKPHGRGIFLISKLADEVKFSKNGRQIEILFDINQPKS